MSKKKIAILFKSSNVFGYGHMYRVNRLIKLLKVDYNILPFSNIDSINYEYFKSQSITVYQSNSDNVILKRLKAEKVDCLLIDRLNNDEDYIIDVKKSIPKVIIFDDCGFGAQHSDVLINALIELPDKKPVSFYHGHSYIIYDDIYDELKKANNDVKDFREVLITFGGSDPNNISELIIPIIEKQQDIHFSLVLGPGYKGAHEFITKYKSLKNLSIKHNINNLESLITSADLCIVSGGLTLYECLYLKKYIVVACQVDHQLQTAKKFSEHLINLGIIHKENMEALYKIHKILYLKNEAFKDKSPIQLSNGKFKIKEIIDKEMENNGINYR